MNRSKVKLELMDHEGDIVIFDADLDGDFKGVVGIEIKSRNENYVNLTEAQVSTLIRTLQEWLES